MRRVGFVIEKPNPDEYLPMAQKYIDLVSSADIIVQLHMQRQNMIQLLGELSEEQAQYKYAEGKWSIKTILGHIADVERLWQYRLLRIARGDSGELSGYDRDSFAEHSACDQQKLVDLLDNYDAVRQSTLTLMYTLQPTSLTKQGIFNEHPLSVRAIPFLIAGHELHHINIIKSRYL